MLPWPNDHMCMQSLMEWVIEAFRVPLQYVFAITEPLQPVVGGHVWRSDNYGRIGSWTDVTEQMSGELTDAYTKNTSFLCLRYTEALMMV